MHQKLTVLEGQYSPSKGVVQAVVRSGSAKVFRFSKGDRVKIVDTEGGQKVGLATFVNGKPIALVAVLSLEQGHTHVEVFEKTVADVCIGFYSENDSNDFRRQLRMSNVSYDSPVSMSVMTLGETPRAHVCYKVLENACCVVESMEEPLFPSVEPGTVIPTPIVVEIQPFKVIEAELPLPLAEVALEKRVKASTAEVYHVKKGQYIQIIDVSGQQASDFLAFDIEQLNKGVEKGLDCTATRTFMGSAAIPFPGLASYFFNEDNEPMVQMIQDTVGRHDTFGLACTPKYYEDNGYPGHPSCTENFNNCLQPYKIRQREGWPAINFFFNTWVDASGNMNYEEPWSRPGDYVLLRACKDLLCASSACSDDISPTNGWRPTDIHVRVYGEPGMAFRPFPDSIPELTRESGFHSRTSQLTREFVIYQGFWLPKSYRNEGPIREHHACRNKAVVIDLSALRKFEILGPDAENLMQVCLPRNVRRLGVGQIVYSPICYPHGGMLDDGTLFRLGANNFRWVGADEYDGVWFKKQAQKHNMRVTIKPSSDQLHNIAVQGPLSKAIISKVLWTSPAQTSIDELAWFRFTVGRIGNNKGIPVMVSRTGYTGELGYEVWSHPKNAPAVWDAIWEAGMAPMGLDALNILRIESGLIFSGYEFCSQIDPFMAGIGFSVFVTREEDFIGKTALKRIKDGAGTHVMVGLSVEGTMAETPANGDKVFVERASIGAVTSGVYSPLFGKNIALAQIFKDYAEPGTKLEIGKLDGFQKRVKAVVVKFPFYDPEKKKPRGI